jgi:hypothetical protein
MCTRGVALEHGKSAREVESQLEAREGQTGPGRMAERLVVARKPGNAGGAKGPWSGTMNEEGKARRLV